MYETQALSVDSIIDSGADWCVFHAEVAEALGIDLKSGKKQHFYGVTGEKEYAYFHNVLIEIGGWTHKTEAAFSENLHTPYGLLGQEGFFDRFVVKFDRQKEEIELKPKFQ